MDLWQALARLRHRPWGLALIAVLAIGLGLLGWTQTKPSYSIASGQAVSFRPASASNPDPGSYETGIVATMVAQNTQATVKGPAGTTLTTANTIVNPPLALPLISMTVTASSPDDAKATLKAAKDANATFLRTVTRSDRGTYSLIDTTADPEPSASAQSRVRAAGAGFLLGLLGGLLVLIVVDAVLRRRTPRRGRGSTTRPTPAHEQHVEA